MLLRTLLDLRTLFASVVLLVIGNTTLGTIAALRLEIDGVEPALIGLVLALTSLGFVLGSLQGIRIIQRVGHIRAFAAFALVASVATLMHPLHVSIPAWMAFRLVLGFCVAGLLLIAESWVNARATAGTRGALLAAYMVLFFLAASIGQFIVALGDPARYQPFVFAALLIALSVVPLCLTRAQPPGLESTGRLPISLVWRRSELGIGGAAVSGVLLSGFATVGPVYGYEMGLGVEEIAVFMGFSILAAMAAQWPIGYLSDYLPRRLVIVGVATGALGMALVTAFLASRSPLSLYGGVALFYALAACIYPLCLALTHDMLSKEEIVPASATLLLANGVGAIIGPLVGGASISLLGPPGLFLFLAVALGVLLLVALRSFARDKAPRVQEQSPYIGVAAVCTAASMELAPRQADRAK